MLLRRNAISATPIDINLRGAKSAKVTVTFRGKSTTYTSGTNCLTPLQVFAGKTYTFADAVSGQTKTVKISRKDTIINIWPDTYKVLYWYGYAPYTWSGVSSTGTNYIQKNCTGTSAWVGMYCSPGNAVLKTGSKYYGILQASTTVTYMPRITLHTSVDPNGAFAAAVLGSTTNASTVSTSYTSSSVGTRSCYVSVLYTMNCKLYAMWIV